MRQSHFLISICALISSTQPLISVGEALAGETGSVSPQKDFALDQPLGGIDSPYTRPLLELAKSWMDRRALDPGFAPPVDPDELSVRCYGKPGNDLYLGIGQFMTVRASVEKTLQVLDDFGAYPGFMDGLLQAKVEERDRNHFLLFTEQNVPLPFIPNDRTRVAYVQDRSQPGRAAYRYQLRSSNHLKANDGLILLEEKSPGVTVYREFDFFDADWGLAKALGGGKIWSESLEAVIQSDLAVKLRTENSDWKTEKVLEESKRRARVQISQPAVKEQLQSRKPWPLSATSP